MNRALEYIDDREWGLDTIKKIHESGLDRFQEVELERYNKQRGWVSPRSRDNPPITPEDIIRACNDLLGGDRSILAALMIRAKGWSVMDYSGSCESDPDGHSIDLNDLASVIRQAYG